MSWQHENEHHCHEAEKLSGHQQRRKIQFYMIIRPSFEIGEASYTKLGIQIRCVRPDQLHKTNVLHYLERR